MPCLAIPSCLCDWEKAIGGGMPRRWGGSSHREKKVGGNRDRAVAEKHRVYLSAIKVRDGRDEEGGRTDPPDQSAMRPTGFIRDGCWRFAQERVFSDLMRWTASISCLDSSSYSPA